MCADRFYGIFVKHSLASSLRIYNFQVVNSAHTMDNTNRFLVLVFVGLLKSKRIYPAVNMCVSTVDKRRTICIYSHIVWMCDESASPVHSCIQDLLL